MRPTRNLSWLIGPLLLASLWSCKVQVEPGRYRCDPRTGGVCPTGWSCLPFGTAYECHREDLHHCGDGVLQPGEQCDGSGNMPGSCLQYGLNPGNLQCTSVCTALCTACGNNAVETGPFGEGEQCDDGNLIARDGCSPNCKRESPTWIRQTPALSPSPRHGHAMVYDTTRHVAVLFGGISGGTPQSDTWEYDGDTWVQIQTANVPAPRSGHAMAYDASRDVTVLFGGALTTPAVQGVSDTWEYDGVDWIQLTTPQSPSNRFGAVAAHDPLSGVTVLFGGMHNGIHQGGTWEFDGATWHDADPQPAPGHRLHATLVWAPSWQGMVLFGGASSLVLQLSLDDTWVYRDSTWRAISPTTLPTARHGHGSYFDTLRERMVVFGGIQQPEGDLLTDPWEFDGQQWAPVQAIAPPTLRNTSAVYLPQSSTALVFGGQTSDASTSSVGDTWWVQYLATDSVCGDSIRDADEICDGSQIAPEYDLSCTVLGFSGGDLACRSDCRIDVSGCVD